MDPTTSTGAPLYIPTPIANPIAMSPNYATALVIGVFIAMMVAFATYMLLNIQTSEVMSTPDSAYQLPEKKRE